MTGVIESRQELQCFRKNNMPVMSTMVEMRGSQGELSDSHGFKDKKVKKKRGLNHE